jgi:ribosomal protein S16
VAAEHTRPRNGKFIEIIGTYDPKRGGAISLVEDKVKKWISNGASYSLVVRSIIRRKIPGFIENLEKGRLEKIQAARKKRKARAKIKNK